MFGNGVHKAGLRPWILLLVLAAAAPLHAQDGGRGSAPGAAGPQETKKPRASGQTKPGKPAAEAAAGSGGGFEIWQPETQLNPGARAPRRPVRGPAGLPVDPATGDLLVVPRRLPPVAPPAPPPLSLPSELPPGMGMAPGQPIPVIPGAPGGSTVRRPPFLPGQPLPPLPPGAMPPGMMPPGAMPPGAMPPGGLPPGLPPGALPPGYGIPPGAPGAPGMGALPPRLQRRPPLARPGELPPGAVPPPGAGPPPSGAPAPAGSTFNPWMPLVAVVALVGGVGGVLFLRRRRGKGAKASREGSPTKETKGSA
ncbi:MAG: LPXTG cell wall anchor domain-containing protein [Synechococcaceae cyanobacterium]|nr:LPXTG cell wall anchor domain-containing protein [Synechococcaceae cyanobacterium]